MSCLTPLEWSVLNATADDAENLEQIYKVIAFEFSAENYSRDDPDAFYWRERTPPVLLADVADAVHSLLNRGLLQARSESEDGCLWRSWFEPTAEGRRLWKAEHAAV